MGMRSAVGRASSATSGCLLVARAFRDVGEDANPFGVGFGRQWFGEVVGRVEVALDPLDFELPLLDRSLIQ